MNSLYPNENQQEALFKVQDLAEVSKIKVSVGICAHNEERNIGKLLAALLKQETKTVRIHQILVVSASTDETDSIVKKYRKKDKRIKLVIQKKREGKASAVNLFLKEGTGDVLVLLSADTWTKKSTIENLVVPFLDSHTGMTGGRPIPTNDHRKFIGSVSFLLWKLHHEVSAANLENPKCGEIVAFRNIIKNIPKDTVVDEAWIEMAVRKKGLAVRYAPDAIVYNHGPENISDFLKQRRRIYNGHLQLKKKGGYEVPTMKISKVIKVMPRVLGYGLKDLFFFIGAVFLEVHGRFLGAYDFYVKKTNPYIWDMATSTKEV
jgi:biofilm PGA synthesis N-glycosyltransferase PgaC